MRVAVVGGGVAGLACALALRDRGHDPVVLERERAPGGKLRTERVGEWRVELGPSSISDAPATRALYARLGLEREVVIADDAARRRFVVSDGRLREVPDSPPKMFLSSALTLGEKWRLLREPSAPPPPAGDETVAEWAFRRLGPQLAARFVEPMVSGVFAGDYARLSAKSALPRVVELEREHGSLLRALRALERKRRRDGRARAPARLTTLAGGMAALPEALARELGAAVRSGVEVRAVEKRGDALALATSDGPLDAERVVLALPPDGAAAITAPLDAAIADAYTAIPQVAVAAVSLGFARGDVGHALDGFGFLVPRRERLRLLGCIFASSAFPSLPQAPAGHVLLRCLLGGAQDPHALELSDGELIAAAREALRPTLAVTAAPPFAHVHRWPRAIAQYEVGHAARAAVIDDRGARLGVFSTGAALRGPGVNDVVRDAAATAERLDGSP